VEKRIRTKCSIEIDDVFVVQRLGRSVEGWCQACARPAMLVTPEDAAMLSGMETRAIYRMVEAFEIHWAAGPGDLLLLCLESLLEKSGEKVYPEWWAEGKKQP